MRNSLPASQQSPSEGETPARRDVIAAAFGAVGLGALSASAAEAQEQLNRNAPISPKDNLKITKLETILVKPRWLFLKIHTNAGIVGLGEPITEGRALTCAEAVKEIEPYLIGKDPRPVGKHWQAIYRHAFYRGGPILTSALSGIDQALWDIKGKALGVPVYELLGGPTRDRVRVYAHASTTAQMKQLQAQGFTAFKTGVAKRRPARYIETQSEIRYAAETFAELRKTMGEDVDIAIDFHGAISPATAKLLIKAYEPYQPMFIEEPCQAQNHDVMAEIARGTFLPIATGERVFTKWGFREVLEKKAATVLQPDMCHAGGITEVRLIAGMAEAYYADIAPHNPLGPISLAAGVQLSASIPNFLCQEQVSLGEGYLKQPLRVRNGYLDLPTGPGLGVELDENAMADKIGHDWRNQESYDSEDNSVVDW
jgi:galactonate dehydratase